MQVHELRTSGKMQDREQLFSTLNEVKVRSQKVLAKSNAPLKDVLKLSEHVANMKKLLAELELIKSASGNGERMCLPISDLKEHYDDLERIMVFAKGNPPNVE
jgi:hypothetical protein